MLTHGESVISVSERKDFKKASWHNVVKYMKSYRIIAKYKYITLSLFQIRKFHLLL